MENERSIQLSNLTLKHLVAELKFLENGFVNNVQTLENGWMKMKVHTKQGDKNLVLTPNALFISNYSLQAKSSPGGFSALLKKYLDNQRIISLAQRSADRIVVFEFMSVFMILELFAKGNVILCDKEMKIIKAMRREEWKDRKLEQNEEYKYPSSKGINPVEETQKEFDKKLAENKKTFFGACVDILNTSPAILEYVFDELKLDKKKNATEATATEAKKLLKKMQDIYNSPAKKAFLIEGALYTTEIGKPKDKEFESVSSALNALMLNEEIKENAMALTKEAKVEKESKYEKEKRAKENQMKGLLEQAKQAQEKGEQIYLKYNELKELVEVIKKGKAKGLSEKEIIEKINSKKKLIKEIDFKKNKLIVC